MRERLPIRDRLRDIPQSVLWSLLAVLVAWAVLCTFVSMSSGYSDYYATAVKSMSTSWRALFFGSFDPQATITLDKLSGFLVPQAVSARLFGFSPWALAIPQMLEGLVTIVAVFFIVRRWMGDVGGLVAALSMALTPLLVSTFSHPMEDGMLTMFTVLAVLAWQRSIDTGRLWPLLLSAVCVGLGFQAKMLQAWLLLPPLAVVYGWVATVSVRRRLLALLAAAVVVIATSFSWMTLIQWFPIGRRPFVDGTTDDSMFSMVLGYNGVNRFLQNWWPGALHSDPSGPPATVGLVGGIIGHTPLKLFLPQYATQIGWFYPLVAAGLVLGIIALARHWSTFGHDQGLRIGVLLSCSMFIVFGAVLSVMSLPHTAYLASMAFPLASLTAIGVVLLYQYSQHPASKLRFALPLTVAVQTVWMLFLISRYGAFAGWLLVPVAVLGFGASILLLTRADRRPLRDWRHWPAAAATAAIVGALLAPMVWSASTIDPAYAGSANDAYAGPEPTQPAQEIQASNTYYGVGLASNRARPRTAAVEAAMFAYASAHSTGMASALATDSWRSAAPLIMQGARRVLPIGGYTSRVPSPTKDQIVSLVQHQQLRFILLTGSGSKNSTAGTNLKTIRAWVTKACTIVPASTYGGAATNGAASGAASHAYLVPDRLYDCR